jgi:hypothetical protein
LILHLQQRNEEKLAGPGLLDAPGLLLGGERDLRSVVLCPSFALNKNAAVFRSPLDVIGDQSVDVSRFRFVLSTAGLCLPPAYS